MDDKIRDIEDKSLKINPYTVPEGYFGSLEGRIMGRIGGCGAEGSGGVADSAFGAGVHAVGDGFGGVDRVGAVVVVVGVAGIRV